MICLLEVVESTISSTRRLCYSVFIPGIEKHVMSKSSKYLFLINSFISRYDGSSFTNITIPSTYDHAYTYFSIYNGNPFIVGDSAEGALQTEILVNGGTEDQSWTRLADYPYGKR